MTRALFDDDGSNDGVDVTIQLMETDPMLRAGFTAQILFIGDKKRDVIYIPRQALFMKDGRRVVYVKSGGGYEQRVVKIDAEGESRSVVEGLSPGTLVALVDPTAPRSSAGAGSATASTNAGTP
jgi:hypothetical protein